MNVQSALQNYTLAVPFSGATIFQNQFDPFIPNFSWLIKFYSLGSFGEMKILSVPDHPENFLSIIYEWFLLRFELLSKFICSGNFGVRTKVFKRSKNILSVSYRGTRLSFCILFCWWIIINNFTSVHLSKELWRMCKNKISFGTWLGIFFHRWTRAWRFAVQFRIEDFGWTISQDCLTSDGKTMLHFTLFDN